MSKHYHFEEMRIYAIFSFILMSIIYFSLSIYIKYFNALSDIPVYDFSSTFAIFSILNFIRYYYFSTVKYTNALLFFLYGCFDIFFLSFYFGIPALDQGGKIVIMFLMIIACIYRGRKLGITLTLSWFPINVISNYFFMHLARNPERSNFNKMIKFDHIIDALYFQVILFILVLITNEIYRQIVNKEKENERLLNDLELHYKELNTINEKLTYSVGEFFTLQQVSQAIGSILDINELMKFVNDIILGVMGVKASTIILLNNETSKLEVHTTNITIDKDYESLCQNINCEMLLDTLYNSTTIFNNNVDSNEYNFTHGRNVKSLICIPICAKKEKFGLILIEQDFIDAFNEDKVRLLTIIAQQVAMALENAVLYQKMHELAMKDALTGAYNRMHFNQRLEKELELAQKNDEELTLAMFDIDYFKKFNDTYGHLFGDKVLKIVANLVSENIRSKDVFARIGGEEFIIILPATSIEEAYVMVEDLRKKIANYVICDNIICTSVTASFGIASYPKNSRNIKEILKNADDALYDAKKSGRNCVKIAEYLQV